MSKPKALDLFCGAGGATKGLQLAGFHVTGVDIKAQPRYCGDEFFQADALTFPLEGYNFIWAGPPCQGYSHASLCQPGLQDKYPRVIDAVRERLRSCGAPWVIENVYASPLKGIMLCGAMFGRETYRHRLFESSDVLLAPPHSRHGVKASRAGHWKPGTYVSVAGNVAPIALSRHVMDIDWMRCSELAESIPPYFSEFIGKQAIQFLSCRCISRGPVTP